MKLGLRCAIPRTDLDCHTLSAGTKTAADAARLFAVHPATVSRLLARAGAGTIGVRSSKALGVTP
jgi:hypothetical protein